MSLRRSRTTVLALATAAAVTVGPVTAAVAAPVCADAATRAACGGRVVAEPDGSATFLQFDNRQTGESLAAMLAAIEGLPGADRYLEVMTMAEATGDPANKSFGGRDMWVVRVTDELAPRAAKAQVAVSLSVHGAEAAGREGGIRYVEDLARMAQAPTTLMYGGDTPFPFSEVMTRTETWIGFTNPDGWAAGDLDVSPGVFARGNDNGGKDLNRDYPTVGWMDRTGGRGVALSEPDTRSWADLVDLMPNLKTSTDIHGELTTPNDAFSDLIIPAGQWSPTRQDQVNEFSLRMIRTVERKFEQDGVTYDQLTPFLPSTGSTPTKPANVAASYDIVGYDDSGFMGDWFSQRKKSVHMDVENFLSNIVPNNAFAIPVEEAHVAAVRGNIEATIVEALLTDSVEASASYGRIAYVDDPNRTRSDDANGTVSNAVAGETQIPYDVSRLEYFPLLAAEFGADIAPVTADAVAAGVDLSGYDTVVVTDMELPAGSTTDMAAYVAALKAFATAGGQLLLTDRAVGLADDLGLVATSALTLNRTDAGHVDFVAPLGDHPYEEGLVGKPSQTYYEVMLGYPSRGRAPNYGVQRTAWEAAGGSTVATVGAQGSSSSPNTALGTMPVGAGQVVIFGAILPQAIEELRLENGTVIETPHPFGLADFAPTITGGQVLDNIFAFGADTGPTPVVPEAPVAVLLPLVAALAAAVALRRRRTV